MPMGRKATVNLNLPPQMRARVRNGTTYYFYDAGGKPRKEISLGKDYVAAVQKWTTLHNHTIPKNAVVTFKMACDRYMNDVLPTKTSATQKDYLKCFSNILKFFNNPPAPLDAIEAVHIREYLDFRGKQATTRANRECSVISTVWNHARSWGYTNNPNPCEGVKRFKETKRTNYISDQVYQIVYDLACQPLKDAIDLGYLTGQRPADIIKMYETDIQNDVLLVTQNKTKAKIKIAIKGQLKTTLNRILERRKAFKIRSLALVLDEHGKPLSQRAIWARFDKVRSLAILQNPTLKSEIENYQIRDLRAKAGTDKAVNDHDIRSAQKLLGHSNITMTERYVREISGQFTDPTK
jgi:integrase